MRDIGFQFPRLIPLKQTIEVRPISLGLNLAEAPPKNTNQRTALQSQKIGCGFGQVFAVCREPDHQNTTVPVDAAKCLLKRRSTDRVINYIRTTTRRHRLNPFSQLRPFFVVIDRLINVIKCFEFRQLLIAPASGNHFSTQTMRDVDGGGTNASRRPKN